MSSDVTGRRTATSRTAHARPEGIPTAGPGDVTVDAPAEVLDFIRYCYRRRGIGWPELYDEMCAVAARGSYRGMDYDALGRLGIGFSLKELPRLAALSGRIVAEERQARTAPRTETVAPADEDEALHRAGMGDEATRIRAAMMTSSAG